MRMTKKRVLALEEATLIVKLFRSRAKRWRNEQTAGDIETRALLDETLVRVRRTIAALTKMYEEGMWELERQEAQKKEPWETDPDGWMQP